ncbi:VOC family protein [Shewanella maritima]|uniref:VOC family protein n=1 Tax=Shewanella maritima TaxID=2520507 RepID=A0A411PIT5_9GAMM|nr:VOC family protein [Shewanella maritima]QBF83418.1 VOC family protein [Shewanella maritima]
MKVESYIQGQPCWVELASHDWQAGKSFYQQLFNWQLVDMETPDGHYTTMQIDGGDVAAMYQMSAEIAKDTPSHWTIYFAVDNVDETIERVKQAGGQLVIGPHNVGDAGRMAVFLDPEGASFAVWQAMEHSGIQHRQMANTLCWVELACSDTGVEKQFYSQALGLNTKLNDSVDFEYTEWHAKDTPIGGMMAMTEEWGDMPTHWMSYFDVDDCDAMAARAAEIGGKVCVPPTDIPQVGRFAVINDPQGAVFSIIQLITREY